MAEKTNIAWCDSTFNPWIGCTRVSPGCDHCYAKAQDSRKRWGGVTHWGPGVPRQRTGVENWKQPERWNRLPYFQCNACGFRQALKKERGEDWMRCDRCNLDEWTKTRRRVFCGSLCDFADNEVPEQWRIDLENTIARTRNLSWLLVTKRIGNVQKLYARWAANGFPENVRILITVVNPEEAKRDIPKLLDLRCRNGVSYEPAIEQVNWYRWMGKQCDAGSVPAPGGGRMCPRCQGTRMGGDGCPGIEWLIVGGESAQGGHHARPFNVSFARLAITQARAAGVPVFVKQMGSFVVDRDDAGFDGCESGSWPLRPDGCDPDLDHYPFGYEDHAQGSPCRIRLVDRAGADPAEWPEDIRIREFPK